MKKILFAITGIIVILASGILIYFGVTEAKVSVIDDSLKIAGVYGVTVPLSEITGVTMIEYSMEEIGIGDSKGSFRGMNGVIKGRFIVPGLGEALLFVSSPTSPTLWIERADEKDIFISFADGIETEHLYREIKASLN